MTSRIALAGAAALAALFATPASAQTAATSTPGRTHATQPIVMSGLFSVSPDGSTKGSAVQTGEYVGADMGGIVYFSPCSGMGAANADRHVSAFATDVWVMSGKVIELTEQHASVQIGVRRTKRAGQDDHSPEQSLTLALKRGERYRLEEISVPATGLCQARTATLDVVFASRQEMYGITDEAFARGSVTSAGGGRLGYVQGGQRQTDGSLVLPGQVNPSVERRTVDLWLVRSTPGQPDETQHLASQLIPIPIAYAFPPVTIQTAAGPITIKVEGTVEAGLSPDGQRRFHFAASRTVSASTTSSPARDLRPVVEGSTKTTVAMPEGNEVLAFEMPPLRTPDGTTLPDRLSIRVRISPSQLR
jgi:hypothetical protein